MQIGVPKEIKDQEYRVGLTPAGAFALCQAGHEVLIQQGAGAAIGYADADYQQMGARIVADAHAVYQAPLVVKVKEPQPSECELLHPDQILFTYLHLAADAGLTRRLLDSHVTAIAYETVTDHYRRLPLLIPMSEVAGRLAIQAGATALQMISGGNGTLLGGVPGVAAANVVVLGGGIVGTQAARMAMGLGAQVTILDNNLSRLRTLDDLFGPLLRTRYADAASISECLASADLVIGAVLIPGKQAPKLITRNMLKSMKHGAVIVDVAIDQGGCAETSRPTTHSDPIYVVDNVVHYCVANMPGACARTSTQALSNATLPYVRALADRGLAALGEDPGLMEGLNIMAGKVTCAAVADDLGYPYAAAQEVLAAVREQQAAA